MHNARYIRVTQDIVDKTPREGLAIRIRIAVERMRARANTRCEGDSDVDVWSDMFVMKQGAQMHRSRQKRLVRRGFVVRGPKHGCFTLTEAGQAFLEDAPPLEAVER